MRNRSWTTLCAGVLVCFASIREAGAESPQDRVASILSYSPEAPKDKLQPDPAISTEDCRGCHEDTLPRFNRTYHASLEESCFACHQGAAAEDHLRGMQEGEDVPGPSIEALASEDSNAICMTCHETTHQPTWQGSAHERRDLKCIECHSVHNFQSEKKQLKEVSASETCSACHQNIRAQGLRTSHHPVREGLMGC
ncbi:MAG TPA: hypothetical protein VJ921_14075, partial [Vicinamibacteria bacterium]|nr:hypothetical protein [Vicinamibacteria bacterium]